MVLKKLILTNDPFNKPQLLIKNYDFKVIIEDEDTKIRSKWTNIVLDDFLTLPAGPRRINTRRNNFRWGAMYDKEMYDGFYIFRNFDPIYFNQNRDTSLKNYSKFHLQRGFSGETNSFPKNTDSVISPKIKQNANFLDIFGIDAFFKTPIKIGNLNQK